MSYNPDEIELNESRLDEIRNVMPPGMSVNNEPMYAEDGRLIIRIMPSARRHVHAQVLGCLRESGRFFEQGGIIVHLQKNMSGDLYLQPVNSADLMLAVDSMVVWERLDNRRAQFVPSDPPDNFFTTLLRANPDGNLQPVAGIARQPFLRDDGSVCSTPGYDAASRLYGVFQEQQWNIPESPIRDEAQAALRTLKELLKEFPFADASDRSAALSAVLTATIRPMLPTAPMFHIRAHMPGTGKTYLSEIITTFAAPHIGAPLSFPGTNDECDKLLLAEMRQGTPIINFDNLTGDILPLKKLCTVLTSERMSGRVLGSSRSIDVSTRALILSSGNNVGPVGDMIRRCITINLDTKTDNPATRTFSQPDLLGALRQSRSTYVAAALVIMRAWINAGRPRAACPGLSSFDRWSDWCRQSLLWLGEADPAASIYKTHDEDPDRQLLAQLLTIWSSLVNTKPVMVRDLVAWADPSSGKAGEHAVDVRELLEDITSGHGRTLDRRRLGWWLKHRSGHVVNGLRLELVAKGLNAQSWRVVKV